MAYIGTSPSNGVRRRFVYEATASQTSFSGSDENGVTLTYVDSLYLDVFQNGIKLKAGDDYTATTGTSVVLVQGASLNDVVEMVAFDVFSVGDTVSAKDGGSFAGTVGFGAGIAGGVVFNEAGADVDFRVESDTVDHALFVDGATGNVAIGKSVPLSKLDVTGGFITVSKDANTAGRIGASEYITGSTANDLIIQATGSAITRFYQSGVNSLNIDATGAVTMPLQPAFLVQPASTQSNVAEGTNVVVIFGTERFDVGSNFASNAFTAPVTGKYFLSYSLFVAAVDNIPDYFETYLVTSNRTYTHTIAPTAFDSDATYWTFNQALVADMDAGDTAQIELNIHNGGTVQSDIANYSYFSGYLAC